LIIVDASDLAGTVVAAANGWPSLAAADHHQRRPMETGPTLLSAGAEFRYFGECHAAYRHWSQNATVSKHKQSELRRRRLGIEERADPAEGTKIVGAIKERQPGFVPEPPAARGQYRWLYQTFRFTAAERAAAYKRRLAERQDDFG